MTNPEAPAAKMVDARPSDLGNLRLEVEAGASDGAWIALRTKKTTVGESGIEWLSIEITHDRLMLSALDPTTLVTLNQDPLPPTPIAIRIGDIIGVNDYTLKLVTPA